MFSSGQSECGFREPRICSSWQRSPASCVSRYDVQEPHPMDDVQTYVQCFPGAFPPGKTGEAQETAEQGKMKQQESSHGKTHPVIRHEYHDERPVSEPVAVINNQKSSVICGALFSPHEKRSGLPLVPKTRKNIVPPGCCVIREFSCGKAGNPGC